MRVSQFFKKRERARARKKKVILVLQRDDIKKHFKIPMLNFEMLFNVTTLED